MKKILNWCLVFLSIGITAQQVSSTIGAGANNSSGTNGDPIYRSSSTSSYHYSKSVQLLTAADLNSSGIQNNYPVNSIAYYKTSAYNVSGTNSWTINVYLKNSSATALASGTSWTTMTTGATLFYTATINSTNNFPSTEGWVNFDNNTGNNFTYTGGAIEVYIDWVPGTSMVSPYTGGAFQWKYDSTNSVQALGTSNSSAIATSNATYTTQTRRYQTRITYTAPACTGTPAPGNTISSTIPSCPGAYVTNFSLQNVVPGYGVTYQWYNNSGAIAGATSSTLNNITVTSSDSYYCGVTCSGITTNSSPISVSPSPSLVPSYSNDFATSAGACTSQVSGGSPTGTAPTGTTAYWTQNNWLNSPSANTGNGSMRMNLYSTNRAGWLKMPSINLSAGGYRVKFDYGATTYSGTAVSAMGSDDVVQFVVSQDGGNTWTVLKTWNAANSAGNTTSTYNLNLTSYTNANTVFAFYGSDGTVDDSEDYNFYIDNFVVETIPSCDVPSSLTSSNITANSASVSWVASVSAPANGYEIYYSTSNTAPTSTTILNSTNSVASSSLTAQIPNLLSATTYYVWVRSVCSTTDKSSWSQSSSFMTLCSEVANINENFDTTSTSGSILPNCWSKLVTGTSSNAYVQASTIMSAPNNLYVYANSATEPVIVKLPSISTLSTGNYAIKFKGRANYSVGGKIDVGYMTDPTVASSFVILGTYTTTSTTTVDDYYLAITGVPAGVTTLALRNAGTPAYSVLIDDVRYDLASVLNTNDVSSPVKNNIKVYPNPFTDVLNISDIKNVKSISVMDVAGRLVKSFEKPTANLQLSELNSGMYLVVLHMNDGTKQTVKAIKK